MAVVDGQMEQTRRQVINLPFGEARLACAEAAWRSAMHHAAGVLASEPMLSVLVDEWREAWGSALVYCYRGDMAKATGFISEAYRLRDSLWIAVS